MRRDRLIARKPLWSVSVHSDRVLTISVLLAAASCGRLAHGIRVDRAQWIGKHQTPRARSPSIMVDKGQMKDAAPDSIIGRCPAMQEVCRGASVSRCCRARQVHQHSNTAGRYLHHFCRAYSVIIEKALRPAKSYVSKVILK